MHNIKIFLQFARYKIILALFFAFPSFAQQTTDAKKIDSLLQLVKVCRVDTVKVELYNKIINLYFSTDYTKIKPYNNLILSISKINKFEKGFAYYYYNRALFNSFTGNHELARILAQKSSFFCKKLNLQANYHQSQYVYAQSLYKLDKKDDAIKIAITVLNTKYKRTYADAFAKLNYLLGCIYKDKLEFTRAIKYIDVATKLFIISKNINGEYCCYNEKIITLMVTNQYKKAIKLSDEKVKYILKTNLASSNNLIFESLLINNAKIYADTGDYLNAKIKINECFKFFKTSLNGSTISYLYNQLAIIEIELKNYEAAKSALVKALENSKESAMQLSSLNYLSKLYLEEQAFGKARQTSLQQIELLKRTNQWSIFYDVYNQLATAEKGLGNYKKALKYKEIYEVMHDSFIKIFNNNEIKELTTKYELEEKNLKLKNYESESLKNKLTLNLQSMVICFGVFIICLSLFFINKFKIQNHKLKISEIKLNKLIEIKEILIKEIHHRVKNSLQTVNSLLLLQAKKSDFTTLDSYVAIAGNRINALAIVYDNLNESEKYTHILIQTYLSNLVSNINNCQSDADLIIAFDSKNIDAVVETQSAMAIGLIVNELVHNAIKHAFNNMLMKKINVSLQKINSNLYISVIDNGIGTDAIINSNQKSMGFYLIKRLCTQISAEYEFKNVEGFQVIIKLPI